MLQITKQEHIITQWTAAQAALATLTFEKIGSVAPDLESNVGALSTAIVTSDDLKDGGPFDQAQSYFQLLGEARYAKACEGGTNYSKLGAFIFLDITKRTKLFTSGEGESFALNHMYVFWKSCSPSGLLCQASLRSRVLLR